MIYRPYSIYRFETPETSESEIMNNMFVNAAHKGLLGCSGQRTVFRLVQKCVWLDLGAGIEAGNGSKPTPK